MKQVFFIGDRVINEHSAVFTVTQIELEDDVIIYSGSNVGWSNEEDLSIFLEREKECTPPPTEDSHMVSILKKEIESLRKEVCRLLSMTR
jgi:hypothetical protein